MPTCYNSKPLINQLTVEDASWRFLDGVFNWRVFLRQWLFLTYPGPMVMSPGRFLKQKAPCDYELDSFIHISFESITIRFRRLPETSPTLPCSYKHVPFTFLYSIEKSSRDSPLWTWTNKLIQASCQNRISWINEQLLCKAVFALLEVVGPSLLES